jgi:hypothetical protein
LDGINPYKLEELLDKLKVWLDEENAQVIFEENPEFDPEFELLRISEIH